MERIKLTGFPKKRPPTKFICPDGKTINASKCVKSGGCRMASRCKPLTYLLDAMGEGDKTRSHEIPSVTQLIQSDPMKSYLEYKWNPPIDLDSSIFAVFGTAMHEYLDKVNHPSVHTEGEVGRLFYNDVFSGKPDCYIAHDGDEVELIDYKVVGAFQVKKMLGIGGKVKGVAKKVTPDFSNYDTQLNAYKILIEHNLGIKITKMSLFIIVRDGGMAMSMRGGIARKTYYFDVPLFDQDALLKQLAKKSKEYKRVFKTGEAAICKPIHRWGDDRKCKQYCAAKPMCPYGREL